jgi:hypothetical protein
MWCKPFLSPPKLCKFFTKQIVMWATFQSIGLQGWKKPVSSPTFGASSLNQWKLGWAPLVNRILYSSRRILKHKCEVKTQWDWSLIYMLKVVKCPNGNHCHKRNSSAIAQNNVKKWPLSAYKIRLQSHCVFTSHLQGHTYMPISRCRV